ncbi:MAG: hypothetical protein IKA93_03220, partial [Elusimicrobiaceae bacterium]|nr:hypothetical protein [Elusimicrobiaceae bacterium]
MGQILLILTNLVFPLAALGVVLSFLLSPRRDLLKHLILYVESHIRQEKNKAKPSEALTGTYEEMYSNWRNK